MRPGAVFVISATGDVPGRWVISRSGVSDSTKRVVHIRGRAECRVPRRTAAFGSEPKLRDDILARRQPAPAGNSDIGSPDSQRRRHCVLNIARTAVSPTRAPQPAFEPVSAPFLSWSWLLAAAKPFAVTAAQAFRAAQCAKTHTELGQLPPVAPVLVFLLPITVINGVEVVHTEITQTVVPHWLCKPSLFLVAYEVKFGCTRDTPPQMQRYHPCHCHAQGASSSPAHRKRTSRTKYQCGGRFANSGGISCVGFEGSVENKIRHMCFPLPSLPTTIIPTSAQGASWAPTHLSGGWVTVPEGWPAHLGWGVLTALPLGMFGLRGLPRPPAYVREKTNYLKREA